MPGRKPLIPPRWVRYEVSHLLQGHIDAWEGSAANGTGYKRARPGIPQATCTGRTPIARDWKTATKLLDLALRETGPVRFDGRLYKSSESTYRGTEPADASVQNAESLFVEIHSPINGMARKCK